MLTKWKKGKVGILMASAAFLLAACGGGEEGGDTTETTSNGTSETTETGGDFSGQTLNVSIDDDYKAFVDAIAPAFEEEHGVTIEVTERDMFENLEALPLDGPANLGPDVMIAPYDRVGGLGLQGHLLEVILPDDDRYDETDNLQVTAGDTVYGNPFVIEALVMYYNKALTDTPPATFEELEKLAQDEQYAFPSEAGKSSAFLANWVDFYHSYGLLAGFGGYVFGEDGTDTTDIGLNSPEAIEAISYAQTWFQEYWPQGMLDKTTSGNFIDDQFVGGNTVAVINGPWAAAAYRDGGIDFGVAPVPTLPNGEEYAPFAGGKAWIISSYTEVDELAQEWLNYVTNEENMMLLFEEHTNEIPANQTARQTIQDAGDNELAVAVIEQYNTAVPMPNIPEMAEVWVGAETMMFDAGSGNKTPEEAANDTVEVIQQNIEQKY
ncbi:extracellular solute-binding protein [Jeotgalibaca caeni]|uniref:extracellular solute-binding protein n=1 Tax=Jeotgalibaca caeni TaxID=3028623 RepID=UPI00237E7149|nr:extracellular solute-binding protein [Jeotgalibaca caeni]MDE1548195.1 extracellular solute-binding protein [Jeotgalibaca caeni]